MGRTEQEAVETWAALAVVDIVSIVLNNPVLPTFIFNHWCRIVVAPFTPA